MTELERTRRYIRNGLKRGLSQANLLIERAGFRIEPLHYYSDVPARRELARSRDAWARPLSLSGMDWDLDEQLGWLAEVTKPFIGEVHGLTSYRALESGDFGPGYGPVESQVLHCVVRHVGPKRVVEVGSGLSTMVTLQASRLNASEGRGAATITCIEPNPRDALRREAGISVVPWRAQDVPWETFAGLDRGDILFIDSTHTVKTGSELIRLYLEIIPRLPAGVLIHIHDIYLPYPYAPDILFNLFDWQETTLAAALLTGNTGLSILACLSGLHHGRQNELQAIFSDYRPCDLPRGLSTPTSTGHFPSSLWLMTTGARTSDTDPAVDD